MGKRGERGKRAFLEMGARLERGQEDGARELLLSLGPEDLRIALSERSWDGKGLLHIAIEEGEEEFARKVLELGADPNARDEGDLSPLHLAARRGKPMERLVGDLLRGGADARATAADGGGGRCITRRSPAGIARG